MADATGHAHLSEPKFQAALIRLASAVLLPILSLPRTHCEECQLRLEPQQHAFRLHLHGDSLSALEDGQTL
jgi:hypothetical protein